MSRSAVCEACGAILQCGIHGKLPRFCSYACRATDPGFRARRREQEKRYQSTAKGARSRRAAQANLHSRLRGNEPDYLIANLLKMKTADVPPEVIELKREQLRLHRLSKQMQQAASAAKENE